MVPQENEERGRMGKAPFALGFALDQVGRIVHSKPLPGLGRWVCRLRLADGGTWALIAEPNISPWFYELAWIMELENCALDGEPKLIFSKMEFAENEYDGAVPVNRGYMITGDSNAWAYYDYGTARIWIHDSIPDAVCEVALNEGRCSEYINMRSSLQPIYQRSISLGGMPFHAALAEVGGRAVLLAGWSGTGKSTCSRRLPAYWKPLCDDETLVVLDEQKEYRAHPFPTWGDYICEREEKTWNVQYSAPLYGVFFLEHGEKDEVMPVGEGQAVGLINESAAQVCRRFWMRVGGQLQREFRRELFENACEMAKRIPAFRLCVSLHGRFWERIEEVLEGVQPADIRRFQR